MVTFLIGEGLDRQFPLSMTKVKSAVAFPAGIEIFKEFILLV